jgi:hypothetical protein
MSSDKWIGVQLWAAPTIGFHANSKHFSHILIKEREKLALDQELSSLRLYENVIWNYPC